MNTAGKQIINRNTERIFLLLVTAVMVVLFYKMYLVLNADFTDMPSRLKKGTMINLNGPHPAQNMKTLLQKGRYFRDEKDIDLISAAFENARVTDSSAINNIGDLNKKQYSINSTTALREGGETFRRRVKAERVALGFTDDDSLVFGSQNKDPAAIPSANDLQMGMHSISG